MNDQMAIDVRNLKKYFPIKTGFLKKTSGYVRAVEDVSIYIRQGETLGLVGESGCGKTTIGMCILKVVEPTAGTISISVEGADGMLEISDMDEKTLRPYRKNMQMIFQDPYNSLDPRKRVEDILGEPLVVNGMARGKEYHARLSELMTMVGLDDKLLKRYPHAFSGGQRQRIGIARALATNPKFIVCDEAVSALDVSVKSQILNLLLKLQEQFNLSYLFISHDLSVVRHISHRVAVMYVGKMVESANTEDIYITPKHPYTEALLASIPVPNPRIKITREILGGEVANPANPPTGCYFHPRCKYAKQICAEIDPEWREVAPDHFVACHFADEINLRGIKAK